MKIDVSVLIPALNPGSELVGLVQAISDGGIENVIVVDDGSGSSFEHIFTALKSISGVTVIRHAVNQGKGRALKSGFNYFLNNEIESAGVVTADADGQHKVQDILKVAQTLVQKPNHFILGARKFSAGVPLRSWLGNQITKFVYMCLIGKKISDTQSGLRGLSRRFLPFFLKTDGEAYDYEMNMLIQCKVFNIPVEEVPIETVYIEGNKSSHFNPFFDSMKIYFLLLRFVFSSLFSSIIDFIVFAFVFNLISARILVALVSARAVATVVNFLVNRKFVFHIRKEGYKLFFKYYALVIFLTSLSYLIMRELVDKFGTPVLFSKVTAELVLFIVSFTIQRDFIFKNDTLTGVESAR